MSALLVAPPVSSAFPVALLPALLEVSLTAVCVLRPVYGAGGDAAEVVDFMLDYASPAARRMLDVPEADEQSMLTRFPETRANGILEFCCRVFASAEAGRYGINYQTDGLDNYFHLAALRQGGQLVVSFTDTAEHGRSAVEEALRRSQAREQAARADADAQRLRLVNLIEQAPVLIAVHTGPTHIYEVANDGYRRGLSPRTLLGRPIREALPDFAGMGLFEVLDQVYRTGETYFGYDIAMHLDRYCTGEPRTYYLNIIYQATRDAAGGINGVIFMGTEMTEQVLARQQIHLLHEELAGANAELRASNAALEQRVADRTHALLITLGQLEDRGRELAQALAAERELGELKSNFVTLASHEFRTPLAVVLSSAELIARYPGADQQALRLPHLNRIRTTVEHLNEILEEFLTVGLLEEGKVEMRPVPFDVSALLAEAVADLRDALKAGQTIDLQLTCPAPCRLDASLLRKILLNLLTNALKYSGENSVVTVRAGCHDQRLTLLVQDQGVGISEEDQAHLFERFFRARSVANVPGTGLGLYIIARYLELMGGTIDLRSELGVGTAVTLTIPYENDSAA